MFYVIKLVIGYNGTHFSGWQRQQRKRTVQGVIEQALSQLFKTNIEIDGAGRTDRGVHAYGQVATFSVETTMPAERFHMLINRRMPPDIEIHSAEIMPRAFHARYSAKAKRYCYKIHHGRAKDPMRSDHYLHVEKTLDLGVMREVAKHLIGEKDFRSFMASGSHITNTVREVYDIVLAEEGDVVNIEFYGNGFLYNMVRIMVGLMLDVEAGRIKLEEIEGIIAACDRTRLKHTAPAHGLYLVEVCY
ncbi:MAG: tRNA pseudouridine(38-40) synthase TruA [Clostridia bacterium]|nr:tRNA pseudouridine(38-40) synthase TruA [Clostridia bacterium]